MGTVPSTSRGSAESTPSTSFQTWTSFNPSALPITVAVKSLPPRPSVHTAPVFSPLPRNPVTTRTTGSSPGPNVNRAFVFENVASRIIPFSNSSVVTNMSSIVSTCSVRAPNDRRYDAKILVLIRSPKLTSSARVRDVTSCISAIPVHTCSSFFNNFCTSAFVTASVPSASIVSSCSLRIARSGSSASTPSSARIAISPAASRLFVVLPIADSTSTGISSGNDSTICATSRMRAASATDEPPNFMTTEC
mmetsp:Transcript_6566/g.26402  ORF Transcript_6566/g.26402 Transcript_6566/m.26402 type:complete len:249 (+) Transcript_6566:2974-3720(+)